MLPRSARQKVLTSFWTDVKNWPAANSRIAYGQNSFELTHFKLVYYYRYDQVDLYHIQLMGVVSILQYIDDTVLLVEHDL
jgi:hypothetical protein